MDDRAKLVSRPWQPKDLIDDLQSIIVGIVIDNNKTKPKTNADRIRAMSDEELAKYIEEVEKRVCEEMKRREEMIWRDEREREQDRIMRDLELRLIAVEKKNGIDHPSHKCMEAVRAGY